jgi:hypothetical protein
MRRCGNDANQAASLLLSDDCPTLPPAPTAPAPAPATTTESSTSPPPAAGDGDADDETPSPAPAPQILECFGSPGFHLHAVLHACAAPAGLPLQPADHVSALATAPAWGLVAWACLGGVVVVALGSTLRSCWGWG